MVLIISIKLPEDPKSYELPVKQRQFLHGFQMLLLPQMDSGCQQELFGNVKGLLQSPLTSTGHQYKGVSSRIASDAGNEAQG